MFHQDMQFTEHEEILEKMMRSWDVLCDEIPGVVYPDETHS